MLNAKIARELIQYEPLTGRFFSRERARKWFSSEEAWRKWNKAYAGREILKTDTGKGYLHGVILGKAYRAHRVAWLIQTGEWPTNDVDHINTVRSDNRWTNLRVIPHVANCRNRSPLRASAQSIRGLHFDKSRNRWQVSIQGKKLGRYRLFCDALAVRKDAEKKAGFTYGSGGFRGESVSEKAK